jgi:formylglycine-generating enzyme required for sulfatase activity
VKAPLRADAGRVLAVCGDPRPEVVTLDEMEFCLVPAGPFRMGSSEADRDAYGAEKPQTDYLIPYDYWVARYPSTFAQYRVYERASGGSGRADRVARGAPANHPVVWVSWTDAMAFCEWLTRHWRERGLLAQGWAVVLPCGPEWEKAARGDADAREYPWGDGFEATRCNSGALRLYTTTPVGIFPDGASPYGCLEMGGNVWEWTRSQWNDHPYPADAAERRKREDVDAEGPPVLRGGAFDHNPQFVRCAYRDHDDPGFRDDGGGFRVVLSPFFSEL